MICPYCKEEIQDGAVRCKHCQATLGAPLGGRNSVLSTVSATYDKAKPFMDVENLKHMLLSWEGRLNRAKYWAATGLLIAAFIVAFVVILVLSALIPFLMVLMIPLYVILGYVSVVICIKRFHDLDKSGHWVWCTMIPLFNLYVYFLIMCVPGTRGANKYGEDLLS